MFELRRESSVLLGSSAPGTKSGFFTKVKDTQRLADFRRSVSSICGVANNTAQEFAVCVTEGPIASIAGTLLAPSTSEGDPQPYPPLKDFINLYEINNFIDSHTQLLPSKLLIQQQSWPQPQVVPSPSVGSSWLMVSSTPN